MSATAKQLFGIAIGTSAHPSHASDLLTSFARSEGFGEPPATYDNAGDYLRLVLFGRGDGGCWCLLEEQQASRLSFVAQLARHAQRPLDVFEVVGLDKPVRTSDGEFGYAIDVRAHHITADGTIEPPKLATALDESDAREAHGDFYETVSSVLWSAIEGALPPSLDASVRLTFYRARSSDLAPRLQGILDNAGAASGVALETIDGHQFLKLTLPTGSRLVRVTAAELQLLRASSPKIP